MNLEKFQSEEKLSVLRRQLQILSTVYNSTRDLIGLLSVDRDGDFTFVSANQATLASNKKLGLTNSNFLDIKFSKFVSEILPMPESQQKQFREKLEEVKQGGKEIQYEAVIGTPDNNFLYLKIKLTPVMDAEGLCEFIVFNCADVSETVKVQKSLEKNEKLYRSIFESIQDVFFRARLDWSVNIVSPSIKNLLEAPYEDLAKINFKNWVQNPEDLDFLYEGLQKEKKLLNFELPLITRAKHKKIVLISCWLGEDPESRIRYIEGLIRDVSDLKSAELEARENQEQLFQSSKLATLGTLVSGMGHEINNPNNNIMFNASILRKFVNDIIPLVEDAGKLNPDLHIGGLSHGEFADSLAKITDNVIHGTHRIKNIVGKLKDYSRQESGMEKKWLNLNDVIASAIDIIGIKIQKATRNFSFIPNTELPKIWANFSGLEQVAVNLIDNACQALPDVQHYIKVHIVQQEDKSKVELHIEDNGEGIPESIIHQISDPFFTTRRKNQKMGLGLSIANAIVLDHGGKIDFFSYPGQVTVVRVTLPVKQS